MSKTSRSSAARPPSPGFGRPDPGMKTPKPRSGPKVCFAAAGAAARPRPPNPSLHSERLNLLRMKKSKKARPTSHAAAARPAGRAHASARMGPWHMLDAQLSRLPPWATGAFLLLSLVVLLVVGATVGLALIVASLHKLFAVLA